MTRHTQVKVWNPIDKEETEVDEKLVPFLKLLWDHDINTMMSCQDPPHPGKEGNVSCGRVWLMFYELDNAKKFVAKCIPHPKDPEFEMDSLYNRVFKFYAGEDWNASRLDDPDMTVDKNLWQWECSLSDVHHGNWFEDGDRWLGPTWPNFEISVRFPFEDIEQLMKNLLAYK